MYRISPAAHNDLLDIWIYISERATDEQADGLIEQIGDTCSMLSRNPHTGRLREELSEGIRSFPIGRYLLFYDIVLDNDIVIH